MPNPLESPRPQEDLDKSRGLSSTEAAGKLKEQGLNVLSLEKNNSSFFRILLSQFKSWLVVTLLLASAVSFFLGERLDALVIISVILLSVFFGFFQEYKTDQSLQKLKKYILPKAKVKRDDKWQEIESKFLVMGDLVRVQAGDLIPADIELITSSGLSVDEAVLTGESLPVEKSAGLKNKIFMGTTVVGGWAEGRVLATGLKTSFGQTVSSLEKVAPLTDFQKETAAFSSFLFKVIIIMTIFVFLVNSFLQRGILDSLLFALALAVGITPELLPAIITVTLSQGALKMAKEKVVVKRLMSVEDLGNIDTLCTDKTGTLTEGKFTLINYINVEGQPDDSVLMKALLCSGGFAKPQGFAILQPVDKALWENPKSQHLEKELKNFQLLDERDFDFGKRTMAVLVKKGEDTTLIVKGAFEKVLAGSSLVTSNDSTSKLDLKHQQDLKEKVNNWENQGYRVIALAQKREEAEKLKEARENDLTFLGFLLFTDPIKHNAKEALNLFQRLGVAIKILSGDSAAVTKNVSQEVGFILADKDIKNGEELEKLTDQELEDYAQKYNFFARVTPTQKYRLVKSLNKEGHIVGFLGDGINDAPALKAADVGISVNSGAEVAKEAADIVLLRKDLHVLGLGIEAGRKTFANIMKYIRNTVSANFGNMFTVSLSSLFLSFIPLLPSQILLNNFLSDLPLLAVATDKVDRELLKKPKKWRLDVFGYFMVYFGLLSSFFDLLLIVLLNFVLQTSIGVFRTSWFIESSISEIIVTFAIRTSRPFYKSLPSLWLALGAIFSISLTLLLSSLALFQKFFGFVAIPTPVWLITGLVLVSYFLATELLKQWFFKRWEF